LIVLVERGFLLQKIVFVYEYQHYLIIIRILINKRALNTDFAWRKHKPTTIENRL